MACKSLPSTPFLSTVAERWSVFAESLEAQGVRSDLKQSEAVEKMGIEIRSAANLALVEAWERGNCLDATIMNLATGDSRILFAGPCNGSDEIDLRLAALRDALSASCLPLGE